MMLNNGWQARGLIAWDGSAYKQRDMSGWNNITFQFEVVGSVVADAIFEFESYAPQAGNACAADLATEAAILDPITCQGVPFSGAVGTAARVTIPAGTAVGTIAWAAVPVRPGKFVGLKTVSGTVAQVRAVVVMTGPNN